MTSRNQGLSSLALGGGERETVGTRLFLYHAVIAMHYPQKFKVDEVCEAFVKAHPRRLFQATEVCRETTNNY